MREANTIPGYLEVARAGDMVYVKGHGQCLASMCVSLCDFSGEMIEEGFNRFVFDLEDVTSLDSTFMGTLIGLHALADEHIDETEECAITVVNVTSHCMKQMRLVGLNNLLCFLPGKIEFPSFETTVLEDREVSESERIKLIKEAHERLVEVDSRNEDMFGALLSALRREA